MSNEVVDLIESAEEARRRAYAPYSGFHVGCALETESGDLFLGCNIENASYPVTICAERVALGSAIAAGHQRFRRLVLVTDAVSPASPCGMCRQALAEFGPEIEIISRGTNGEEARWTVAELLPERFSLDRSGSGSASIAPSVL
jgi:cytidine deaminase